MATIYVSGGGTALRDAIVSCSDGDEIVVGDGNYTGGQVYSTISKSFSVQSEHGPLHCSTNVWFALNNSGTTGQFVFSGFTITNPPSVGTNAFRYYELRNCIVENITTDYHACGNQMRAYSCLFRNCRATTDRLSRQSTFANCSFVGNIIAGGTLNYNSTFRNCLFAGNARTAGGTPLTNYGAASSNPNCMAGAAELVDANGRPVSGSPAYGGGSATYLQTPTDLVGTPWRNPPAIGCYEFVDAAIKPTIPTRMLPFGV